MTDTTRAALAQALEALRLFTKASYPVSTEIEARAYRWCDPWLDGALSEARAAITAAEAALAAPQEPVAWCPGCDMPQCRDAGRCAWVAPQPAQDAPQREMLNGLTADETGASASVAGLTLAAPQEPVAPAGYELLACKGLHELVEALDRAESKGYMPDAVAAEWEAFEYRAVLTPPAAPARAEPTDEQIDRAVAAWFEGIALPHHAGPKFRARMRDAIKACGLEGDAP